MEFKLHIVAVCFFPHQMISILHRLNFMHNNRLLDSLAYVGDQLNNENKLSTEAKLKPKELFQYANGSLLNTLMILKP